MIFENREEAGNLLSLKLRGLKENNNLVIGITRGGVVTAKAIAQSLKLPLDIMVVKKMGALDNPELAIGAVGPENTVYWDENLYRELRITNNQRSKIRDQKLQEQKKHERILRGKKSYNIKDKTIILVDDGVATGTTVITASKFLRKKEVKEIILAVPVIAKDTAINLNKYFEKVIYLDAPKEFYAVSQFYREFPQISEEEIVEILKGKKK